VVEAGMGGRLDSTNVIMPMVSVITNIDVEHTEFLGDTIEKIAGEKAGIIKPGVPVITGTVQPETIAVIERTAALAGAPVYRFPEDFGTEPRSTGAVQAFDYRGIRKRIPSLRIGMLGQHQIGNACLALAAVECVSKAGFAVPDTAIRTGLANTAWEGRLERVTERPDIYLDGAHNPASARVLADAVRDLKKSYRHLVLILGILMDKDYRGIVSQLAPMADRIIVTRPHYSRALSVVSLAAELGAFHRTVDSAETVAEAVRLARQGATENDLILITGSLYTVGDARAVLRPGTSGQLKGLTG
jgi:dihydrofolate synthase / folylpolyglutamate synthase